MSLEGLSRPLALPVLPEDLERINAHLRPLPPQEILRWALDYLPGLAQTTAFGLTGLVAIDMLSKLTPNPPPLIFLDTLYHFPETYELVEEVKRRCYRMDLGCGMAAVIDSTEIERPGWRVSLPYVHQLNTRQTSHDEIYRLQSNASSTTLHVDMHPTAPFTGPTL